MDQKEGTVVSGVQTGSCVVSPLDVGDILVPGAVGRLHIFGQRLEDITHHPFTLTITLRMEASGVGPSDIEELTSFLVNVGASVTVQVFLAVMVTHNPLQECLGYYQCLDVRQRNQLHTL